MYQLTEFPNQVKRLSDKAIIPFVPGNKAYEKYLEWLAEGNTPLPADELPQPEPDDYVNMRKLVRYLRRTRQALVAAGITGLPPINELFD